MVCAGSETLSMGSEDGGGRRTEQVSSIMAKGKKFGIKEKLIFAQRFQIIYGYEYWSFQFQHVQETKGKKRKGRQEVDTVACPGKSPKNESTEESL